MNLPAPPPLTHYLFENPFPICACLLAFSIGMLVAARRSGAQRAMKAGLTGGGLMLLVFVVAMLTRTPRERILLRNIQLVRSVEKKFSEQGLQDVLGTNARLYDLGRPAVANLAGKLIREYGLSDHQILGMEAVEDAPGAGRSELNLLTHLTYKGVKMYVRTGWLIHWKLDADDQWRIGLIEWTDLNGQKPDRSQLPR